MRQGQQNRRGRGRNNNRKSQNPLTRSFESTGPDVKIRGTPSHIAEKYMSLARDALSSGDPVLAENYMQHAEHYNRIIMSFREQQLSQGGSDPFPGAQVARGPHLPGDPVDADEYGDDDGDDMGDGRQPDLGAMPQPAAQPRPFDQPQRFDNRNHQQHRRDRPMNPRQDRGGERHFDRQDRGDRGDNRGDRQDRGFDRQDRSDRPDRGDRPERADRGERGDFRADRGDRNGNIGNPGSQGIPEPRPVREPVREPVRDDRPQIADVNGGEHPAPRRRERFQPAASDQATPVHQQPEFLRRPVRRPRAEPAAEAEAPAAPLPDDTE